jgi:hypothetical protein
MVSDLTKQILLPDFPLAADDGITVDGIYFSFYMKSNSNHTHIELNQPGHTRVSPLLNGCLR